MIQQIVFALVLAITIFLVWKRATHIRNNVKLGKPKSLKDQSMDTCTWSVWALGPW